jgi:FAD/FMN-containing dehydrogenase
MGAITITRLSEQLDGQVITPGDDGYDRARTVFVGGIDRRPAVIVRAASETDVVRVVSTAAETDTELAVRSGGHSGAGHSVSEGGIVLDLSRMNALDLDPHTRTAWAGSGMSAAEYTIQAGAHGLATGFGDTGSVGIGGITLGGGVGFLVRKYGLTIDDLLAAEVVTADGTLRHVDADTEPDLFWAIRGGGGNFGVATRFRFRLHQVGTVMGGMLFLPATPETIAGFLAEAEAASDELSTIANVMPAPPMPFVPQEHHGRPVIMAMMVHAGELEAGRLALEPFRALAEPLADMLRPLPYPEMYMPEEEGYHPIAATRNMFVDRIDGSVANTILDHLEASSATMKAAQFRVLGGAMARVPADSTAFAHRSSRIMVNLAALYERTPDAAMHEAWVDGFATAIRQSDAGAYVNFLTDEGPDRVRAAYPGPTWDRLVAIKSRYDPSNVFRLNQNIPPEGVGP